MTNKRKINNINFDDDINNKSNDDDSNNKSNDDDSNNKLNDDDSNNKLNDDDSNNKLNDDDSNNKLNDDDTNNKSNDDDSNNKSNDDKNEIDIIEYGTSSHINFLLKNKKYQTLEELITLGESFNSYMKQFRKKRRRAYYNNVDLYKLHNIIPYLQKLNNMIGMDSLKIDIVHQLLYYLSGVYTSDDLMHTVIMGSPGCGKTEVSKILANIYISLGFLSKGHITFAKRSDMIAEYLGQTAVKTQKLLNSCKGGCLIIDEAYSLGHSDKRDSYSKECIDTINQFLTEHKDDFMCIIIGYEKELKTCFFNFNPGLERRFSWKYSIQPYSAKQLHQIFISQIRSHGWRIKSDAIDIKLFENNISLFSNYGGDTEVFFTKCKMSHTSRIFGDYKSVKRLLTDDDIKAGFNIYKKHKNNNEPDNTLKYTHMYT
jgi:hypothetical protein